jgi:hypothetical protein
MTVESNEHITASVRLLSAVDGGGQEPVTRAYRACIFVLRGELFDCRVYPDEVPLKADVPAPVTIRFLHPELVMPLLCVGDEFLLRDFRVIGTGSVQEITINGAVQP